MHLAMDDGPPRPGSHIRWGTTNWNLEENRRRRSIGIVTGWKPSDPDTYANSEREQLHVSVTKTVDSRADRHRPREHSGETQQRTARAWPSSSSAQSDGRRVAQDVAARATSRRDSNAGAHPQTVVDGKRPHLERALIPTGGGADTSSSRLAS